MPRKKGRRVKKRTHGDRNEDDGDGSANAAAAAAAAASTAPRSFVVHRGRVGRGAEALKSDLRDLLSPNTASKLRERRSSSLKDYIHVAGMYAVTHMLCLTQTKGTGPNLRVARVPRGPTLSFNVESYTLASAVRAAQRSPVDPGAALRVAPLVVMSNFESSEPAEARRLKMVSLTFQAMFPSINLKTVDVEQCRRVLLLSYDSESGLVNLRHFAIRTKAAGVSKVVKRLSKRRKIPNLGKAEDIADYVLGRSGNVTSDAESDYDDDAGCVVLPAKKLVGGNRADRKRAKGRATASQSVVRLAEIGPRLSLRLVKIENGAFDGEVLFHAFQEKTEEEAEALRTTHKERADLKAERKAVQDANVKRKREAEEEKEQRKAVKRQRRKEAAAARTAAEREEGSSSGAEESESGNSDLEGGEESEESEGEESEDKESGESGDSSTEEEGAEGAGAEESDSN